MLHGHVMGWARLGSDEEIHPEDVREERQDSGSVKAFGATGVLSSTPTTTVLHVRDSTGMGCAWRCAVLVVGLSKPALWSCSDFNEESPVRARVGLY